MNIKEETLQLLYTLKLNSHSTTVDRKPAVVIDDCSLDSFLWVMNQAMAQIKDGKPDYKDI